MYGNTREYQYGGTVASWAILFSNLYYRSVMYTRLRLRKCMRSHCMGLCKTGHKSKCNILGRVSLYSMLHTSLILSVWLSNQPSDIVHVSRAISEGRKVLLKLLLSPCFFPFPCIFCSTLLYKFWIFSRVTFSCRSNKIYVGNTYD